MNESKGAQPGVGGEEPGVKRTFRSLLMTHDKQWSQRLAQWRNGRFQHAIAWILARSGDSWLWLLIIAVLLWQREHLGRELLWVVLGTAVIVATAKWIFKRSRPAGPGRAIGADRYAFPSGHAARAAAVAITLAFALPFLSPLWLLWAVAVSLARVILARHYLTDIAGGLAVGSLFGLIFQIAGKI